MKARVVVVIRHVALAAGLVAVVAWLWSLGPTDLRVPPTSLDAIGAWVDRHDAVTLTFALVRLEALVLAGYLMVLTTISAVAHVLALRAATRFVDRLTLPFLRGVFGGIAAVGVVAGPAPLHRLPQTAATTATVLAPPDDPTDMATLHLDTPAPPSVPSAEPEPASAPAPTAIADTSDIWVVQPGDSLWSIAASHLTDLNGGAPTSDGDITEMWQRLIELNRDRLVNPDAPDLIFADQVFVLPAMEAG